jgi:broad specificity phosphatase PhoE
VTFSIINIQMTPREEQVAGSSIKSVVVVRHGERIDYVMRDAGENWVATSERPWDPPLTDKGTQQAKALGLALPEKLQTLNLPPIAAVYSSPFYRCRQTAVGLAQSNEQLQVQVELGLSESINENWFRSWAVQGTDGTWGYKKKDCPELDPETLHSASKEPVQPLLDWKKGPTDPVMGTLMDHDHVSKSSIETPYCLHPPKFESQQMQRNRMAVTLKQLSENHVNETIIMVSHGRLRILLISKRRGMHQPVGVLMLSLCIFRHIQEAQ